MICTTRTFGLIIALCTAVLVALSPAASSWTQTTGSAGAAARRAQVESGLFGSLRIPGKTWMISCRKGLAISPLPPGL